MDTEKFLHTYKKVGKLLESILEDPSEINAMEKDLMKSYLLKLYESLDLADIESPSNPIENTKVETPKKKSKEKKNDFRIRNVKNTEPEISPEPSFIFEEEETLSQIREVIEPKETSKEIPEELRSVFQLKEAKEVSDRLGNKPIIDIATAMSINDKLLTINQLFGGNDNLFKETINQIGNLQSYDDAKNLLIESVASEYEWGKDEKSETANQFIHLVHRKFSSQ